MEIKFFQPDEIIAGKYVWCRWGLGQCTSTGVVNEMYWIIHGEEWILRIVAKPDGKYNYIYFCFDNGSIVGVFDNWSCFGFCC